MKQLLSNFENLLIKKRIQILNKLNNGIDITEINLQAPFLPDDIKVLYNWRNGLIDQVKGFPLGQLWIFNFGFFLSFEESIVINNKLASVFPDIKKSFFPIFSGGGGEYYLVECDKASEQFGKIFFYSISNYEMGALVSKYDTIYHFFSTLYECYQRNVYWYNSEGYFEFNFHGEIEIAKKINTDSQYWKFLNE